MKINIPVVWTYLCSLSGTLVHFLGVSSVTVSLLLHFPSCFILMPRRNCDHLHYVRGPSCSLLGHRLQSEPLLWFILPAVLEITALMYAAPAACFWSSTYSEAWEQWPQGLTVGAKIVQSRGLGIKGWWSGKEKWVVPGWSSVRTRHLRMRVVWLQAPWGALGGGGTWVTVPQPWMWICITKIALDPCHNTHTFWQTSVWSEMQTSQIFAGWITCGAEPH